ncbi:MAG TPA: RNA polymerase factor sigma-54 [Ktedonobacteraceae bacterium]|nr:RNA polymerase factor sigma-54 [Ktedonobacteraceae bacterium]
MIGIQLFPKPAPNASAQLIAANSILQLSAIDLEQAIVQELDENPALEMVEQLICRTCSAVLHAGYCPHCNEHHEQAFTASEVASSSSDSTAAGSAWDAQEDIDPLSFVQAPLTLAEQLLTHLQLALDTADHTIALYVVDSLDEHGYLATPIEELADALEVETHRVSAVVVALQGLDPAGIGARNLTECLLLQLERLSERGIVAPQSTRTIIERYLTELGHHQFESIRVALNVTRTEVEDAFLFIRANLHPYPAYHYYAHEGDTFASNATPVPSVVIYRNSSSNRGYDVEVIESQRFLLRVNPLYQRMRRQQEQPLSQGEREHVIHFLERARLFMSQLQRRSLLLHRVVTYLVDYQRDFLDHGLAHLRPLSQKSVAQALGIHVSMVSRTISGKFVQLPSRELVPLHRFFSAELRTQELIRQIIADEEDPLSDARIAKLLNETYNISLTRQMVANYRSELNIPAARQRAVLSRTRGKNR